MRSRFLRDVASSPARVEGRLRTLAGRYDRLQFCYEEGVIPARWFRFRETRRILRRDRRWETP